MLSRSLARASAARWLTRTVSAGARVLSETPIPVSVRSPIYRSFGNAYGVNWDEVPGGPEAYRSFAEFFVRDVPPGTRPVDPTTDGIASPADGAVHSVVPIEHGRLYQIKGRDYSLEEFLGPWASCAASLEGGTACTAYLRPKDYHHVHAPFDARLDQGCTIPGTLWPVNPWANRSVPDLYATNERVGMRLRLRGESAYLFMVGALCVGGIETLFSSRRTDAWAGNLESPVAVRKGDRLGTFRFGSTVVVLLPAPLRARFSVSPEDEIRVGRRIGTLGS